LIAIEFLAEASGSGVLYRALRDDAAFPFVRIAADPAGSYEVVREEGSPEGDDGGVTLINPFEVDASDDERFLAGWEAARAVMARQRGYLGTRLHRATGPADFRFVNQARWSSPLMFHRATQDPEFRHAGAAMPFPSHPALYQASG
jgi:hypothetical protein